MAPSIQLQPETGDYDLIPSIDLQTDDEQTPSGSEEQMPNHGSDPGGPVVMNVSAEQTGDMVNVSYSLSNLNGVIWILNSAFVFRTKINLASFSRSTMPMRILAWMTVMSRSLKLMRWTSKIRTTTWWLSSMPFRP